MRTSLLQRPMVRRILAGTGSNAYAQATTIAIQLLSLPLFLSRWDVAVYGQWLILSTIPTYLAMADAGMVSAAGNRMTMLMAASETPGNTRRANEVFQSSLAFVLCVSLAALALVLGALALWPFDAASSWQGKGAIAALSAGVAVSLLGGLPEAIYKATHRYALGAALSNTTRLLEWAGSLVGLWYFGGFVEVALGALVVRVVCTAAMIVHVARSTPAFRWGFADASLAEVRACAGPALSFMAFPAANALNFQGMTLVAATVLGPTATVVFNTYRTLARVTVQATATFSHALWPEFSRLYGQSRVLALTSLYRRSRWIGLALAGVASAVVYLAAPAVLQVWAKGQIAFSAALMLAAMVYAAVAGAWHVARVLLLSTNEHTGLAWPFLAASAACVPLAWLAATSFGLIGIVGVMIGLEAAMLVWCSWLCARLLDPTTPPATPSKPIGAPA